MLGPSGWELTFLPRGDGTFVGPADDRLVLASLASGGRRLTRTTTGEVFGFDALGRHVTTQDAAGRTFTVQDTSAAGRRVLGSYGTSDGRRANLSYSGDPLVRLINEWQHGCRDAAARRARERDLRRGRRRIVPDHTLDYGVAGQRP